MRSAVELAERILAAASECQIIRYTLKLQPAGGIGDNVFPQTYAAPQGKEAKGPRYAKETSWIAQASGDTTPTIASW